MEQYFTKPEVAREIINILHKKYFSGKPHKIVDSSCGAGSVDAVFRELGHETWAFDLDVSHAPAAVGAVKADWLALKPGVFPADACVGFNPPFGYHASTARKFVQQAAVLAPSAPFLFFVAPRILVHNIVRGGLWAPQGFRVVGEHRLPANAFFTPHNGRDFHVDAFLFVFSPCDRPLAARTTGLSVATGVTLGTLRKKMGQRTGRVLLHEALSGGRCQMLVRTIGANAGYEFVIETAQTKRFVQITINPHGIVKRKKRYARNASWPLSQHNVLTFASRVNRFEVARYVGEKTHAHRAKIGGRSISLEFLATALQSYWEVSHPVYAENTT